MEAFTFYAVDLFKLLLKLNSSREAKQQRVVSNKMDVCYGSKGKGSGFVLWIFGRFLAFLFCALECLFVVRC